LYDRICKSVEFYKKAENMMKREKYLKELNMGKDNGG